jgi:transcriptional antiterminator NusG
MSKQKIDEGRNWYVIHTYAGYENAVARNLRSVLSLLAWKIKFLPLSSQPKRKLKLKVASVVEEEEKIYPGYILVDMIVTDDSWYVVRNTPRVTGFVGSGVYPVPIDKA